MGNFKLLAQSINNYFAEGYVKSRFISPVADDLFRLGSIDTSPQWFAMVLRWRRTYGEWATQGELFEAVSTANTYQYP